MALYPHPVGSDWDGEVFLPVGPATFAPWNFQAGYMSTQLLYPKFKTLQQPVSEDDTTNSSESAPIASAKHSSSHPLLDSSSSLPVGCPSCDSPMNNSPHAAVGLGIDVGLENSKENVEGDPDHVKNKKLRIDKEELPTDPQSNSDTDELPGPKAIWKVWM